MTLLLFQISIWCNRENGLMAGWWWRVVQSEFFFIISLATFCSIRAPATAIVIFSRCGEWEISNLLSVNRPINLPYHPRRPPQTMSRAAWRLHTPIMHINYSQEGKCICRCCRNQVLSSSKLNSNNKSEALLIDESCYECLKIILFHVVFPTFHMETMSTVWHCITYESR